jgi:hypothetical protein
VLPSSVAGPPHPPPSPVVAFSVVYRFMPEHPVPTTYEDSLVALWWLMSASDLWLAAHEDLCPMFLARDSAGGNICHHFAYGGGKGVRRQRHRAGVLNVEVAALGRRCIITAERSSARMPVCMPGLLLRPRSCTPAAPVSGEKEKGKGKGKGKGGGVTRAPLDRRRARPPCSLDRPAGSCWRGEEKGMKRESN